MKANRRSTLSRWLAGAVYTGRQSLATLSLKIDRRGRACADRADWPARSSQAKPLRGSRLPVLWWGNRWLARTGCVSVMALALTGCAGYQLGSMLPPDIKTVHVPTFINETEEPLIEVATTRAAIAEIQRDGSLRIASADEADSILTVRLIDFRLQPIAFDRDRRAAAEEYRMFITASIILTRRGTDEVLARDPRVTGEATFVLAGDMTSSKQSALPDASRDLAHLIISSVVEAW